MKKSVIITFFAAISICSYAADYKVENESVVFSKVIENTGKSVQQSHDILEAYFATIYNDVNSTEKLNKEDHLIYKGLFMRVHVYTMGMWRIDVPHTLDVAIKDNRVRVMVTISDAVNKSETGASASQPTYNIANYYPVNPNAKVTVVFKKDAEAAFNNTRLRIDDLIKDVENQLMRQVSTTEDW